MSNRCMHFTREMRDANRAGRKTQTRRVVTPQPPKQVKEWRWCRSAGRMAPWYPNASGGTCGCYHEYAQPGLSVGDTFYQHEPVEVLANCASHVYLRYLDDESKHVCHLPARIKWPDLGRWPGRTLPREWGRERYVVTAVRVERLQEIGYEDARKEGMREIPRAWPVLWDAPGGACRTPTNAFSIYWNLINAKRGYTWESNPFVWCYTYEKRSE